MTVDLIQVARLVGGIFMTLRLAYSFLTLRFDVIHRFQISRVGGGIATARAGNRNL